MSTTLMPYLNVDNIFSKLESNNFKIALCAVVLAHKQLKLCDYKSRFHKISPLKNTSKEIIAMANWCQGDLKVRGTKANIERFLIEGLLPVGFSASSKSDEMKVIKTESDITIKLESNTFYLKGTERQFIEQTEIEFYYPDTEEEKTILTLNDYKGAWAIDTEGLARLSKEVVIDFKIYGFERGMGFNQDIEIICGKITKDEEVHFDDYEWECIHPNLGG